jgi:hypothetical protein
VAGDTVASAFEIDPLEGAQELFGDTSEAHNYYAYVDGACPKFQGKGGASNDQVWHMVAPTSGEYVFELRPDGFDGALYIAAGDDPNADCIGAGDGEPNDRLKITLEAGQSINIVVDGSSNIANKAGPYTLRVVVP